MKDFLGNFQDKKPQWDLLASHSERPSLFLSEQASDYDAQLTTKKANRAQGDNAYNSGRWTKEEHIRFIEAILNHGNDWNLVQSYIKTRSSAQARSHSQKFFIRLKKKLNLNFEVSDHSSLRQIPREAILNCFKDTEINENCDLDSNAMNKPPQPEFSNIGARNETFNEEDMKLPLIDDRDDLEQRYEEFSLMTPLDNLDHELRGLSQAHKNFTSYIYNPASYELDISDDQIELGKSISKLFQCENEEIKDSNVGEKSIGDKINGASESSGEISSSLDSPGFDLLGKKRKYLKCSSDSIFRVNKLRKGKSNRIFCVIPCTDKSLMLTEKPMNELVENKEKKSKPKKTNDKKEKKHEKNKLNQSSTVRQKRQYIKRKFKNIPKAPKIPKFIRDTKKKAKSKQNKENIKAQRELICCSQSPSDSSKLFSLNYSRNEPTTKENSNPRFLNFDICKDINFNSNTIANNPSRLKRIFKITKEAYPQEDIDDYGKLQDQNDKRSISRRKSSDLRASKTRKSTKSSDIFNIINENQQPNTTNHYIFTSNFKPTKKNRSKIIKSALEELNIVNTSDDLKEPTPMVKDCNEKTPKRSSSWLDNRPNINIFHINYNYQNNFPVFQNCVFNMNKETDSKTKKSKLKELKLNKNNKVEFNRSQIRPSTNSQAYSKGFKSRQKIEDILNDYSSHSNNWNSFDLNQHRNSSCDSHNHPGQSSYNPLYYINKQVPSNDLCYKAHSHRNDPFKITFANQENLKINESNTPINDNQEILNFFFDDEGSKNSD